MRATSRASAAPSSTRDAGVMPLAVPSQRGFTNSGNGPGSASRASSAAEAAETCPATGTPAAATSSSVQALSRLAESVRASEPSAGIPAISSSTGAQASRFRVPKPSAMFQAQSSFGSTPRPSPASSSRGLPRRTGTWPASRIAPSSASTVSIGSYSASASGGPPGALPSRS